MLPAKSHQPLHNFSLSFLKWGQTNHVNTSNRCRRLNLTSADDHRRDSSDSDRNRPPCSPNRSTKRDGQRKVDDDEDDGVLLERETNNNGKSSDADVAASAAGDGGEVKPWKLRPRRSAVVSNQSESGGGDVVPNSKSRRLLRGAVAVEESEAAEEMKKKKKRRLWISLSKEEIEEDIYALTRSKPARRPKKRNRTIQRLVDNVFPGQYLIGISADSYRI